MPTALELWSRTRPILLFELCLDDLLLLFRLLLVGTKNQFGVGRQRLQENVEPFAVFVGKRHAYVQPLGAPRQRPLRPRVIPLEEAPSTWHSVATGWMARFSLTNSNPWRGSRSSPERTRPLLLTGSPARP